MLESAGITSENYETTLNHNLISDQHNKMGASSTEYYISEH